MMKKEKGILQIDFVTAFVIFSIGSVFILTMYYKIYILMTRIKINEAFIGYATEVCEEIDLENYDEITENRVNEIIKICNIPEEYNFKLEQITNYSDLNPNANDLVKKLQFSATYEIAGTEKKYVINKVKVRERN